MKHIMQATALLHTIEKILQNMPTDWLKLTTHRLDIYDEQQAKTEFLQEFEALVASDTLDTTALSNLPTAYDYIRLGHPLSSVLEWVLGNIHDLNAEAVISFDSITMPILAILRTNLLAGKPTKIYHTDPLPELFDQEILKDIYGYQFTTEQVNGIEDITDFDGSTVYISQQSELDTIALSPATDFYIQLIDGLGSILLINGAQNANYISEIQHVRRRETIAMTPANCLITLQKLIKQPVGTISESSSREEHKNQVIQLVQQITDTDCNVQIGSSGLSTQYAIMMGLVHDALVNHKGKAIKFLVPPNCYGGTNDQSRRVAASIPNVEVMDLPVDGDNDMVQSIDKTLDKVAALDAVPYIIAEIPTNPRVEVPDLVQLKEVLSKARRTPQGNEAIAPVFILDQTFCPNVHFLGEDAILSSVKALSYVSGSKFPSGGKCTAGYCVANTKAAPLMDKIALHLRICDNEATDLQLEILAQQLPSMNQRIVDAYKNTREFVNYIKETLPAAKINFVSEELAAQGFMPSVFSLDLPTKGNTAEEKETYKRALNHKLINAMIHNIPDESKFCVSYGQLKGCYWTIPATSTQGTTKEDDKDYIARVSLSPDMNLERHKEVFLAFVNDINGDLKTG